MQQEADEIGDHDPYLNMELAIRDDPDNIRKSNCQEKSRQRYLALTFIQNSDKTRYAELLRELANGYVQGRNEYPSTLASIYIIYIYISKSI